jgi:hypothetical protein
MARSLHEISKDDLKNLDLEDMQSWQRKLNMEQRLVRH